MSDCPKCGESFEHLNPGELCPDCRPPVVEPAELFGLANSQDSNEEQPARPSSTYPPLGVAILSIWNYVGAAVVLILGLVFVVYPSALSAHGSFDTDLGRFSMFDRLGVLMVAAMFSLLFFAVGVALWSLRNWARWFLLLGSAIQLVLGGPPSAVVSRVISVATICYLLAPGIRAAFYAKRESSAEAF